MQQKRYICAILAVVVLFGVAGCALSRNARRAGGLRLLLQGDPANPAAWPASADARASICGEMRGIGDLELAESSRSPRYG